MTGIAGIYHVSDRWFHTASFLERELSSLYAYIIRVATIVAVAHEIVHMLEGLHCYNRQCTVHWPREQ